MKKLIFFGVLGLFILASCNSTVTHTHNEHDHGAEGHNHATEDHDHSAHGDESGEGHSHETADSHLETAEAHSDEIILPKVKAEAAGVKASIIEPAPFQQVIKTSGQVLAAQGDESVAVATVAGVVSFRGKVTEGMSVGSGTPLVTISSNNIADGDPCQKQNRIRQGICTGGAELRERPHQLRGPFEEPFGYRTKYHSSHRRLCEKYTGERGGLRDHRTTTG